jgi:hypothetical protein
MRVFISFDQRDVELAAQIQAALRRHNIQASSRLDVPSWDEWSQLVDREGAQADGFIFLIGPDPYANPRLQTEWRFFLRHDWDSKTPLVPVFAAQGLARKDLPPFLRNRKPLYPVNLDAMVGDVEYLVRHPEETFDHTHDEESRAERKRRLKEIEDYIAVREEGSGAEVEP